MSENYFMGLDGFVWFTGVVEDRNDPAQLGRVKVRCLGFHTESKTDIPITLEGVNFEDGYEGDFESSRRLLIYTLSFNLKTKFSFFPSTVGLIETVDTFFHDFDTNGAYVDAGVRVTETTTVIGTKPDS